MAMKGRQSLQKVNAKAHAAELLSNTLKWETDLNTMPEILYCFKSTM